MAREAEGPGRLQGSHGRGGMALVTGAVRIDRRGVRFNDAFRPVTRCAVEACGVVVIVARGAGRHGFLGLEADRGDVALGAGDVRMRRVLEADRPIPWRLARNAHPDGGRVCRSDLPGLMTGGTVRFRRPLVVADLAATRWLEREVVRPRRRAVAGDAGEFAMSSMGEGVGEGGGLADRPPGWLLGKRFIASPAGAPWIYETMSPRPRCVGPWLYRQETLLQGPQGVERQGRFAPSIALAHRGVASRAVAGVHSGRVRVVAGTTLLGHLPVGLADVEGDPAPVGMAPRIGAGLTGVSRLHVHVRVVAHPAASTVRVTGWIEAGQQVPHLVAAEALPLTGTERVARGIQSDELRLGRELVARVAVQLLLVGIDVLGCKADGHSSQLDLHLVRQVASLLGAGRVGGLESVGGTSVASETGDVLERRRIRLEMHTVTRGACDPLPGLLRCPGHVAFLAGPAGNLGMRRDLLGAIGDPVKELLGLGLDLEWVAGVAAQAVVGSLHCVHQQVGTCIRLDEGLPAGHEDVAAFTEVVVMHHVVVGADASAYHEQQDRAHRPEHPQLHDPLPGPEPPGDRGVPPPDQHQQGNGHDGADHDPGDHHPAGFLEDPLDHRNEWVRQRRLDDDRVEEMRGERVLSVGARSL